MQKCEVDHLIIADDLILYYGGLTPFMYITLQAFQLFSSSLGLQISENKYDIYSAGMDRRISVCKEVYMDFLIVGSLLNI